MSVLYVSLMWGSVGEAGSQIYVTQVDLCTDKRPVFYALTVLLGCLSAVSYDLTLHQQIGPLVPSKILHAKYNTA